MLFQRRIVRLLLISLPVLLLVLAGLVVPFKRVHPNIPELTAEGGWVFIWNWHDEPNWRHTFDWPTFFVEVASIGVIALFFTAVLLASRATEESVKLGFTRGV